jgi:hypothetical protein
MGARGIPYLNGCQPAVVSACALLCETLPDFDDVSCCLQKLQQFDLQFRAGDNIWSRPAHLLILAVGQVRFGAQPSPLLLLHLSISSPICELLVISRLGAQTKPRYFEQIQARRMTQSPLFWGWLS